jgi:hypothetical protein
VPTQREDEGAIDRCFDVVLKPGLQREQVAGGELDCPIGQT